MWNEWKRIWRHPKRCMILLLLPVFCMFMFWEGEAEGIRISDGVEMIQMCIRDSAISACMGLPRSSQPP